VATISPSPKQIQIVVISNVSVHVDGVRLLWNAASERPIVHSPGDVWVAMGCHGGMILTGKNQKLGEEHLPMSLSIANNTGIGPGANLELRGERLALTTWSMARTRDWFSKTELHLLKSRPLLLPLWNKCGYDALSPWWEEEGCTVYGILAQKPHVKCQPERRRDRRITLRWSSEDRLWKYQVYGRLLPRNSVQWRSEASKWHETLELNPNMEEI
jgi:hypothetical protein